MVMIDFRKIRSTSMMSQIDSMANIEKNSTASIKTDAVIFFMLSTMLSSFCCFTTPNEFRDGHLVKKIIFPSPCVYNAFVNVFFSIHAYAPNGDLGPPFVKRLLYNPLPVILLRLPCFISQVKDDFVDFLDAFTRIAFVGLYFLSCFVQWNGSFILFTSKSSGPP